jgi:hypothetical protein
MTLATSQRLARMSGGLVRHAILEAHRHTIHPRSKPCLRNVLSNRAHKSHKWSVISKLMGRMPSPRSGVGTDLRGTGLLGCRRDGPDTHPTKWTDHFGR